MFCFCRTPTPPPRKSLSLLWGSIHIFWNYTFNIYTVSLFQWPGPSSQANILLGLDKEQLVAKQFCYMLACPQFRLHGTSSNLFVSINEVIGLHFIAHDWLWLKCVIWNWGIPRSHNPAIQIYFSICWQKVNHTFDSFGTQWNGVVFILDVIPVTLTLV